jgi:hypothetical protein
MQRSIFALLVIVGATCPWSAASQQPPAPAAGAATKAATKAANKAATKAATKAVTGADTPQSNGAASEPVRSPSAAALPAQTGIDQPPIFVPADREEVTARVLLRGLDAAPAEGDLEAGLLTSVQHPSLLIRPQVTIISTAPSDKTDKTREFPTELTVDGLVPFGESSAPLLYKGRQVEMLRFSKPGLIARAANGDAFIAREGESLLLVLENPSTAQYTSVRARLRFENTDACLFTADQFRASGAESKASKAGDAATNDTANNKGAGSADASNSPTSQSTGCDANSGWTSFSIPQYAQITLRAQPDGAWFRDPDTQFPKSGKRTGWLTLRYQGDDSKPIYEQNIALQIQFEPSGRSLFWALGIIFWWLLLGALLSLALRVWVPNFKRKRQLNDQLVELERLTAAISTEVDSNLRVLLRVDLRNLNEMRTANSPLWPTYGAYAQQVEQALPGLRKHIEAVQKLDAALIRRRLLLEQGVAPTRLSQIEEILDGVSEGLRQDQLCDEDWVAVNQQLSAAQKLLREPTPPEKEAFEALLSGRWKDLRDHFQLGDSGRPINAASLRGMEACFPVASLLPKLPEDKDGIQWVKSVGAERADLQLSALLLLRDFEFLAPNRPLGAPSIEGEAIGPEGASVADWVSRWKDAKENLTPLLATPTNSNLRDAKALLRRVAEGILEDDIVHDLTKARALLMLDPPTPQPDQKIRFSVRFRNESMNSAAARKLVSCHWTFGDHLEHIPWYRRAWRAIMNRLRSQSEKEAAAAKAKQQAEADAAAIKPHWEDGWDVYNYFEKGTDYSEIGVSFYDSSGQRIELTPTEPLEPAPAAPLAPGPAAPRSAKLSPSAENDDASKWPSRRVLLTTSSTWREKWSRFWLETFQLLATLLVPLAALASATLNGGSTGHWWALVALGFGSDTIKNILVGRDEPASPPAATTK